MHAVSDIGALVEWLQANIEFGHDSTDNLAVLHNQNHMVQEWGSAHGQHNPNERSSHAVSLHVQE